MRFVYDNDSDTYQLDGLTMTFKIWIVKLKVGEVKSTAVISEKRWADIEFTAT